MRCSHCGGETMGVGGRCSACGATLPGAVAAGVLTPVPAEWGVTHLPGAGDATLPLGSGGGSAGHGGARSSATGPISPGTVFGTRYHIIRALGEGGMGRVYHAWDAELGVAVALKVIRSEIADDPVAAAEIERRFKRELLLARQVSHKNVVRIHDLGDINGTKYITMTYVEGADLSAVLAREGKLPVPRVVRLARQVASGLQAAHEVGVVHRDLKPGNVMLGAEDHAQIMDFGIARSATADSGAGTMAGTIVGTLEYMAPEQAQGKPADQRADVYAFGLILYDLLLGRRPSPTGESAVASLMARMKQAPPSPRSLDPSIPEALDAIVVKCVQPDPAARYQTSAELVAALDRIDDAGVPLPETLGQRLPKAWLSAAALALGVLVGTGTWWITRPPPVPVEREPVSVLIADFENRTGDPVFEGSLEQSLAIGIEGASFVTSYRRDLARRVAESIKAGTGLDQQGATLVAVREGIKVLLAGSVAGGDSGYQLSVRAIDPGATPAKELFSASASAGNKADVLKAVGTLATRVREQLGDAAAEANIVPAETFTAGSLEAMRLYSQAQALSRGRDEDAIEHYREAVRLDPQFGRAYAGWGVSAMRLGRREESAEQWKKALSLLDRMTEREKYRTLGGYAVDITRDFAQAVEHFGMLVKLYPADEAGHSNLALSHFYLLDFENALEHGRRAVEIYPSDVRFRNNLALYAMYAGDFTTGATEARRVLEEDPAFHKAYLPQVAAAVADNDFTAAAGAYDGMAATGAPGRSLATLGRADLALFRGRPAEAVDILTALADEAAGSPSSLARKQVTMAEALISLGRDADALRLGQAAIGLSDSEAVVVTVAGMLVDAGRMAEASRLAAQLGERLSPGSRAHGKLIEGRVALTQGRAAEAVEAFRAGLKLADTWLLRFHLGVAYVEAGQPHAAAALAEFESCLRRRGEATAAFLDDVPTIRYLAPVHYWLGRARESIGLAPAARESYEAFLLLRPGPSRDPLAADARRRLAPRTSS